MSSSKKLISARNVEDFIQGAKTVNIGRGIILTPGAKDILRNRGIVIRYCQEDSPGLPVPMPATGKPETRDLQEKDLIAATVVRLLNEEYGIADPEKLQRISVRVIEEIFKKDKTIISDKGESK